MNPITMLMPDPYDPTIVHLEWLAKSSDEKIVVSPALLKLAKKRLGAKWCAEHLLENKLLPTKE